MRYGRRFGTFRGLVVALVFGAQCALLISPAPAATIILEDDFSGPAQTLNPASWKQWWGSATFHDNILSLESAPPPAATKTYSALVTSRKAWSNYSFSYDQRTVKQLRSAKPNTWEVAWSLFRFRDLENYYYFILKPNGWELGKKHGSDAQIFLATGNSPRTRIGRTDRITITARSRTIMVRVNGTQILTYTDVHPITSGAIGLYEEDAHVHFDRTYVSTV